MADHDVKRAYFDMLNEDLAEKPDENWEKVPDIDEKIRTEIVSSVRSITNNEELKAFYSHNRMGVDQVMFKLEIDVLHTVDIQDLLNNGLTSLYFMNNATWPVFVGDVIAREEYEDKKVDEELPDVNNDFNKPKDIQKEKTTAAEDTATDKKPEADIDKKKKVVKKPE